MARRFAKVSEKEIEEAFFFLFFFYSSDLVNTKTTIPLRVGEERWIYTSTLCVSVYIRYHSPPLRVIVRPASEKIRARLVNTNIFVQIYSFFTMWSLDHVVIGGLLIHTSLNILQNANLTWLN